MDDLNSKLNCKSIIVNGNLIESIGESIEEYRSSDATFIDVEGRAIIPGFIDTHNHLIWAGDRFNEHNLRMQGKSYADIANMGWGNNADCFFNKKEYR